MTKEMNRPKKCYVAVNSFFALFSVQVESGLGKQRCAGGLCSINSEMNKELTNCQRPKEHGLNTCAVLMSRLIYDTMIWYYKTNLSWPSDLGVEIPRPKASIGSFSLGFSNRSQCGSSSRVIVRNQIAREGSHTEGTTWYTCTELPVCKCGREGDNWANITQLMIDEDLDDWSNDNYASSTSNVDISNLCV